MARLSFTTNEIYHLCNRGIAGLDIYKTPKDYLHFLLCLKEYNTTQSIEIRLIQYLRKFKKDTFINQGYQPLVEILAYCLMSNHYHLLIRQIKDNGIPLFMQKLGTGYTMYFNKLYKTSGHLFQGRFQAQHIATNKQLLYISAYIHANPLKPGDERIFDVNLNAINLNKLITYPWSSLPEYLANPAHKTDFPEIKYKKPPINKELVLATLENSTYEEYLLEFNKDNKEVRLSEGSLSGGSTSVATKVEPPEKVTP